jgi:trehalose 6-phosphate phosphatase
MLLVGSHGAEMSEGLALEPDEVHRVGAVIAALEQVAAAVEGAWVEHKPAGAALHTRLTPRALVHEAQHAAREAAGRIGGLMERDGKDIVEFTVRADTKGDAVVRLRERLRPDAVMFAGDDVTDEHAFAALRAGDLALKIGDGPTIAAHRIPAPADLAAVLDALARQRSPLP